MNRRKTPNDKDNMAFGQVSQKTNNYKAIPNDMWLLKIIVQTFTSNNSYLNICL